MFLRKDFVATNNQSRFIVLAAPTGIGKSGLVDQAFADNDFFIRVKIAKHDSSKDVPYLYLKELARAISLSSLRGSAFPSFRDHVVTKERSLVNTFRHILADVATSNSIANSAELGRVLKDSKDTTTLINLLFNEEYNDSIGFAYRYIQEVLKERRVAVSIENIQNIDKESLSYFHEFLLSYSTLYLIGEYTTDNKYQISTTDLLSYCSAPGVKADLIDLNKLSIDEILREYKNVPDIIFRILKNSYEQSSGNLHHLQVLVSDLTEKKITEYPENIKYDQVISNELNTLSTDESFILSLVIAHGGKVDTDILKSVLLGIEDEYLLKFDMASVNEMISNLVYKKLLVEDDITIATAQDSVIEKALESISLKKYFFLSYKSWLGFYQKVDNSGNDANLPKSEVLSWQILFKALLNDLTGIVELLNEIHKLSLLSITPRRAIKYLEKVKEVIGKNFHATNQQTLTERINHKITQILYRLWLFEDIPKYTSAHLDNLSMFLYHTSSLAVIGRSDEAIALCTTRLGETDRQEAGGILLVRIAAYRSSNRYDECEEEWLRLYNEGVYDGTKYEGIFLQCSDIALLSHHELRLSCLQKAIEIFRQEENSLNEISARVAYSQQLGYDGNLEEAEAHLAIAREKSQLHFAGLYCISNNLCVLKLQKKESSREIIEKLRIALRSCEAALDRFILLNNLLVAQSMMGFTGDAEATLKVIDQQISRNEVADFDLQRIALFNASVHYNRNNSPDWGEYYLSEARKLPLLCDFRYWNYKLYGQKEDNWNEFRFQLDYYPIHLTYWHFDFDNL
ncbi:hypothetical protein [Hufsiella ginkgonis]|uniref:Uncharacterized protein n=1 Tax=Hufsiella ginkgonis TaxID=2695274 RepID=A0A7K1XSV5_9SPHI|nr:hypothetical protein [Hufsiella ginkgonis]MXV14000.1 hypothetical protein [Hufsiella ginkgonis]